MRTSYYFILGVLLLSTTTVAQTINFDETWKEFLENDKISNMSQLVKPDARYNRLDYAKYVLMNTNSSFCQSELNDAERLMAEVREMDPRLHEAIPGFVGKMTDLEAKIQAYHSMEAVWKQFLRTKEVRLEELEAITAAKTSCEKSTLAKYSYMLAYYHFCQGEVEKSRNIFENRTLRLTEKTSLRVNDVEGLAVEVANMKSLFRDLSRLDVAWKRYIQTGVSPGFDTELPLFPCNPLPKMKEFVLRGAVDVCNTAPVMLENIRRLQAETGIAPTGEVGAKVKELEAAVGQKQATLAVLNEAWEAFIPDNKVKHIGKYGYEYCSKEALIRAYIMDGFAFSCTAAEEMLRKIDSLQRPEITPLEQITMIKINELAALSEQYKYDGQNIESVWNKFVAQGDVLTADYQSADFYCDNIHQIKDWTVRGLSATCEEAHLYLEEIEEFRRTFEFSFTPDLECRVQKLRIQVWDCRYEALLKLARLEAPNAYEQRLNELMAEYGMGARPEVCSYYE